MGGKSGGPLSSWIREFTTLVFVQTVQAFIFAIIMVFILSTMDPSKVSSTGDDYNSAVGIMCVFALTSLFKVEEMVRKIFGIGGTKADHKGAIQSIAKTAFALKLGSKVLDNGKKVVGGFKKAKTGQGDMVKSRKRFQEDKQDLGLSPTSGGTSGGTGNTASGRGQQGQAQQPSSLLSGITQAATVGSTNTGNLGANNGSQSSNNGSGPTTNNNPTKTNVNGNNAGTLGNTNTNRNNAGAPGNINMGMSQPTLNMTDEEIFNSNEIDLRTKQKLREAQRKADEAYKNAKKMRSEGLKDMAKGFAESAGAVVVGPMGAVLGGAEGNIEDAINGLMSGVGLGDAIGTKTVDATSAVGSLGIKGGTNVAKQIRKIKDDMENQNKSLSEAIESRISETINEKKLNIKESLNAGRDLKREIEDMDKYLSSVKVKSNKSSNSSKAYRNTVDDT